MLLTAGLGPTTPRVPDGDTPRPDTPAKPDSAVELYVNDLVQKVDSVTAVLNAIGVFEIQFLLDAATPIGALEENWIRISTQNLESVPRRVPLAQAQLE